MSDGMRRLTIELPEELYWQLKRAALDGKRTLRDEVLARIGPSQSTGALQTQSPTAVPDTIHEITDAEAVQLGTQRRNGCVGKSIPYASPILAEVASTQAELNALKLAAKCEPICPRCNSTLSAWGAGKRCVKCAINY